MATPLYERIARDIREAIQRGDEDYRRGDPLPTMAEVARRYNTTSNTVQGAYNLLRREGFIRREGTGSVVRGPAAPIVHEAGLRGMAAHSDTLAASVLAQGGQPAASLPDVVIPRLENTPTRVAEALGIDGPGQTVMRRVVHSADGRPLQVEATYLPMRLVQNSPLIAPDETHSSVQDELRRLGVEIAAGQRHILRVRSANGVEIEMLGLEPRASVQEITRISYGSNGEPVMVVVTVHPAGAVDWVYDGRPGRSNPT